MVYAFKDEFLFGSSRGGFDFGLCCANTAEDQLSALAEMVGNGDTLRPTANSTPEVPPLEYDLEAELARALNVETQTPVFDPASSDEPAMEFNDMGVEEFENSLSANVAPSEVPLAEPTSDLDENDAFAEELTRLLDTSETSTSEVTAPLVTPEFKPAYEVAPQEQDFSDPAAEFQSFGSIDATREPAQTPHVLQAEEVTDDTAPLIDEASIAAVLGASAALGVAAHKDETSSKIHDEMPRVAQLDELQLDDIQMDDNIAAELQATFDDGDQIDDDIAIPAADVVGRQPSNSSGGKRAAIVVLAIAFLGGAAAMAWNYVSTPSGDAPVILADGGQIKAKPKEAGGKVIPNQDQTVYKTVDGKTKSAPAQKTLENKTEEPINVAKIGVSKTSNRVGDDNSALASPDILKPRSVRTVVVKPDGTIVQSTEEKIDPIKLAATTQTTPKPVKTVSIKPSLNDQNPAPVAKVKPVNVAKVQTIVPKTEVKAPAAKKIKPFKTVTPKKVKTKPVIKKTIAKKAVVKKPKIKKAAPKPKKVVVAKAESLPSVASPYAVQISSRRSGDAAKTAWRKLSKRYASVLGGYKVDIRRSVIKGKGIYYRVRVPASSKANAQSLCSRLKSAGGDCLVTK